ncbi:hypothetical protein MIR68_010978 [Amoeboaphelidium protococcarum]|nr:hypothetical protein MIR68_010978 [Amoeboaphelidium protococcarum]
MHNPEKEAPEHVKSILSVDRRAQEESMKQIYARDAEFRYIWLHAFGQGEILKLMKLWSYCHHELIPEIHHVHFDMERQILTVELTEHSIPLLARYMPRLPNPYAQKNKILPYASFKIFVSANFEMTKTQDGWKVVRQQDYFRSDPIFIVLVGVLYLCFVRPWLPAISFLPPVKQILRNETIIYDVVPNLVKRVFTLIAIIYLNVIDLLISRMAQ